jgi:hypothetical protein
MTNLIETIKALPEVAKINEWKDRYYITLEAARGSRANADLSTKVWLKGSVLTFEGGKGYHSDAYTAAKYALIAAVEAAGGTARNI